jgi:hypothetical protein
MQSHKVVLHENTLHTTYILLHENMSLFCMTAGVQAGDHGLCMPANAVYFFFPSLCALFHTFIPEWVYSITVFLQKLYTMKPATGS